MSETTSRATAVDDRPRPAAPPQPPAENLTKSSARPFGAGERSQNLADAAVHGVLARHWNTLGLRPTMDLAELETSFYVVVEQFPRNPTEEEEARLLELQQAYAVLRRALEGRPVAANVGPVLPTLQPRQRVIASVAGAVGLAILFYLNFGTIKLQMTGYSPDTVVRLAGKQETYGTVIRFDPSHKFSVGPPARAYQLKLAGSDEVIWLGERTVEKGMVRVK